MKDRIGCRGEEGEGDKRVKEKKKMKKRRG